MRQFAIMHDIGRNSLSTLHSQAASMFRTERSHQVVDSCFASFAKNVSQGDTSLGAIEQILRLTVRLVEGNVDVPTAEGRVEVQTVEGNVEMWSSKDSLTSKCA